MKSKNIWIVMGGQGRGSPPSPFIFHFALLVFPSPASSSSLITCHIITKKHTMWTIFERVRTTPRTTRLIAQATSVSSKCIIFGVMCLAWPSPLNGCHARYVTTRGASCKRPSFLPILFTSKLLLCFQILQRANNPNS